MTHQKNLKVELIVNHIIILGNVFGIDAKVYFIIFLKDRQRALEYIKNNSFLFKLYVHDEMIDIELNQDIMTELKEDLNGKSNRQLLITDYKTTGHIF